MVITPFENTMHCPTRWEEAPHAHRFPSTIIKAKFAKIDENNTPLPVLQAHESASGRKRPYKLRAPKLAMKPGNECGRSWQAVEYFSKALRKPLCFR